MPYRYTIEFMRLVADELNGKCLSKEYYNDDTRLKWMCHKGHTWDASYTIIRQGGWCVQCVKNDTGEEKLEILRRIAKKERWQMFVRSLCKQSHKVEMGMQGGSYMGGNIEID